jgi:von Willebrand factor type A domain
MTGTRPRPARHPGRAAIAMLAGLLTVLLTAMLAPGGPAEAASGTPAGAAAPAARQDNLALLDMVVLVDESGSETPQKVADERATVGTIVPSLLNRASRVTVVGFGGVNHVAPNQVATDVACVPTIASGAANLAYLSSCVGKLHRRSETEGDDTDYAAALGQAMSYLSSASTATPPSPNGAIKIILMMTDGAVDVHRDTKQYGSNWQLGEQTAISAQLATAKQDGVQVWPLGFGTQIGSGLTEAQALTKLNALAHNGSPAVCDHKHTANQPHATWVNNPDDALVALDQLYADAACVGTQTKQGTASSGQLTLTIPQIASAAAISVARGSPGVRVSFEMPGGQTWTDASAISGQDSPVEVLHLYNVTQADVGTWKIHLSAPSSLANQLVRATVFWQGAVRAVITANPPSAKLGQPISVALDVLGPNGPITDPSTLSSLLVNVSATGNGLAGTANVPVTGTAGEPGHYTGTFSAPNQETTLTFTGTAAGYGLYTTQVPATVGVGTQTRGFTATPGFSGQQSVRTGGTVTGQVVFTNQTGAAKRVRLVLSVTGAKAALTSPGGTITVPSGRPPAVPFTVTVARDSPTGAALVKVQAVDAASGRVYNTAEQDFTVTKPPGFFAQHRWEILGLIALIIAAALAWFTTWRISRARRDVRHLVATLRRGGVSMGRDLEPEGKWAEIFPFIIRDEASDAPRLDYPPRGQSAGIYQVRRAGRGLVRLTTPTGLRPYDVEVGGPGLLMANGLELSFRDTRHPDWVGSGQEQVPTPADWGGSGGPGGAAPASSPDDWGGSGNWGGPAEWSGGGMPTVPTAPGPAPADSGPQPGATPTVPVTPPQQPPPQPQDPWL